MKESVLEAIGTPLVRVRSPEGATVAAKLEAFNPGGSAKDRPAKAMVEAAEREGALQPGDRVVEPTSGNTGIGLAVVCAARGYDLTLVMPASKSQERRRLMRAYGADIELVDGDIQAARERAAELAGEGAVLLRQFENPANVDSHYRTTAEEILDSVGDREIDAFVAAVGTGGTITGTARRLRERFPGMEVVAVEPERNAVLSTGEAGEDDYQGMGPGFVSDLTDRGLIDEVETVTLEDAEKEARRLAREEGILVGQSSGAASLAAYRTAERLADPALDCPPAPAADEWGLASNGATTNGAPSDLRSDGGPTSETSGASSGLRSDGGPTSETSGASSKLRFDGGPTSEVPSKLRPDGGTEPDYDDCPLVVTVFPDSGERYLSTGLFEE